MSYSQKLKNFATKMLNSIRTLNLFPASPPSIDEHQSKTEKISTFVYIILLIAGCLVLLVYTALQTVTQTITIQEPSFSQYHTLYDEHQEKLSCPCSTIANQYEDFIWIDPIFHPVCGRNFFLQEWIQYNYSLSNTIVWRDFRQRIFPTFQFLASYCSLADNTISNSLVAFNSTQLISIELLSENLFHEKTQQLVQAFIQSTTRIFSYGLDSIRTTTQANYIMARASLNFFAVFGGASVSYDFLISPYIYNNVSCYIAATASAVATIYSFNGTSYNPVFKVPGFQTGCSTDEAVRKSTLECCFNQSCIDTLKSYLGFNQSVSTKALDPNATSSYNTTTLIDNIITNIMVDRWLWNDSFQIYYDRCRPSSCYYTLITKTPFIVVFTTLVGLFGGLAKILRIVVPFMIQFVRRRKRLQEPKPNSEVSKTNIIEKAKQAFQKAKQALQNLNLFRSTQLSENENNEHQLKSELISTRLFISLLFMSLIILLVYTSQVRVTHTITIDSPSLEVYSSLYEKHSDTLTCPCTNIAIAQEGFISLISIFHQICYSDFVDPRWPAGISATMTGVDYVYNRDLRFRGYSAFTMLAAICSLSRTSVMNALIDFNSTTLISKNLLPENTLIAQMNANIDSYIASLAYSFVHSFQIIRDTTQANGLVSSTLSFMTFRATPNNSASVTARIAGINPRYKTYNSSSCSCHDSVSCSEQAYIYTSDYFEIPVHPIPGLVIGCYTSEAMLQSNLLCFFNQTCIDDLRVAMNFTANFTTAAMKPSKLIYFNITSTIGSMVEKIMIEQWNRQVSYINYYSHCQPSYCRYTYEQKDDVVYIITTLIALIGGLSSILQFVVPRLVNLVRKFLLKRQGRRVGVAIVA